MHVVALPVVEKEIRWSKRCKDPALVGTVKEVVHQVSHSKKWASRKATDENGHTQIVKSYSLLQDRFFEHMRDAGFEDFERGERGSTAEHLSVIEYKTKKESERLAGFEEKQSEVQMEISALTVIKEDAQEQADAAQEQADKAAKQADAATRRINELAPKLKSIEGFAREFSDDAEKALPEVGALESAKSYREKKAKPVYERIVKVLRSLFNKYLDLKHNFERLKGDYSRLQQRYASLDASFDRVQEENRELKAVSKDYDTLCRGYGKEKIAARVRAIQEQEAAVRQQRRIERQHRYEIGAR
jgi:chromosome segregation ATPase